MQPYILSLVAADSLRTIAPSAVVSSHLDTVAVVLVGYHTPSVWWNVATLLTVPIGWLVVNLFARKAQKDHYRGQLILEAASAVSVDLLRFYRWLLMQSKLVDAGESLVTLADHAAQPEHMDWMLTARGNERILGPIFPALTFVTVELLKISTEIRTRITKQGALDTPEGVKKVSEDLMTLAGRVEHFRDMLMVSVTNQVFGGWRRRLFFKRVLPQWHRELWHDITVKQPARRAAVMILGEEVVKRAEQEQENQRE